MSSSQAQHGADVLVVGAGPTGLALAAELTAFGVSVMVVDTKPHPVTESRALAIQPRTLEVLRGSVTERLLARGNPAVRVRWHAGKRTATLPLFDMGMTDTAYPFLLFLPQAETEQALVDHLAGHAVPVHWNTRFTGWTTSSDGRLLADVVGPDGAHQVEARYLVGCDGAHSAVRDGAGIGFTGGRYPQTFLLADADADGIEPGTVHVWFGPHGPAFFFPLRHPAAWRLITARPESGHDPDGGEPVGSEAVDVAELQAVVDSATAGTVRLGPPVWSTAFRLHHRQATTYRDGPVFLAGDAAHIHSPAGAQGMNTGIQDAVNLGWKLALVCRGDAHESLLDTYDLERRPVGAFVLRFTDRAFTAATATSPVVRLARTHLAPRILALANRLPRARALAFRTVSQLDVRYPDSLGAELPEGGRPRRTIRAPRPRAGERLPDVRIDGRWFHDLLTGAAFHLVLLGPHTAWDGPALDALQQRYGDLLRTHHLPDVSPATRTAWGVRGSSHLLVRPDGYVAHRREGTDLVGVAELLGRWLT
jgi:2-polyprenyl-6-methoxyphenol hydroxylase-like FAD-dependent oxidoreductase